MMSENEALVERARANMEAAARTALANGERPFISYAQLLEWIAALTEARASDVGREALRKAAEQFRFYERNHRAKITPFKGDEFYENARQASNADALAKAETNRAMAEMCEAALAAPVAQPEERG